jgi:transposase
MLRSLRCAQKDRRDDDHADPGRWERPAVYTYLYHHAADLLALNDWVSSHHVGVIALESTGVFWRPVFNVLEEGRQVLLVNAQHMKAVPGRKTDVKDSQWLYPPQAGAGTARLDALSQNAGAGTS